MDRVEGAKDIFEISDDEICGQEAEELVAEITPIFDAKNKNQTYTIWNF